MKRIPMALLTAVLSLSFAATSHATVTGITGLGGSGAAGYVMGTPEPIPFTINANGYNDDILYVWNEKQNVTLTENLRVDRVADPTAPYITGTAGNYEILAGTVVSSHYVQWDPAGSKRVIAQLDFDSDIFAFISLDDKLFASDAVLGLAGINYSDFTNRGMESGDLTEWGASDSSVMINWYASSPGDWSRLITAYSPGGGGAIPAPGALLLGTLGAGVVGWLRRRRTL